MNNAPDLAIEDDDETRTARLLSLSPDQITQYSFETICDWLIARNQQHRTRLRSHCQTIREQSQARRLTRN
ncbi:hypothetical protein PV733_31675 [Streptomyces europaeiscabiei]|uniref:hypothetical protein n=1 Tax=Streptomyces europaeiscabiei TaxID=146819 RepID=UPI0029A59C65|nr:hypothetical protein [Streptomyces europaeiscabiei]MDX3713424.1 hypothetical protein [Streptomyces europaeiscabiei]